MKIIRAGCLIAAVTYIPLFHLLLGSVNPDLQASGRSAPPWLYAQHIKDV